MMSDGLNRPLLLNIAEEVRADSIRHAVACAIKGED